MIFEDRAPPEGAIVLFNGKDLSGWVARNGGPARWRVMDGALEVVPGAGDILSEERFEDALIHLEFLCPDMPEASGLAKANSGVYIQARYEIQVLDSFSVPVPGKRGCGAIYDQFAPLVNACRQALTWQSYDIVFRAARGDGAGRSPAQARMTVLQNGIVIHNNIELCGPTAGAVDRNVGASGPLLLQDHGDLVRFRNLWLLRLPKEASGSD